MQQRRYEKPPIVEAIIDFRVRSSAQPDLDTLGKVREAVSGRFPVAGPINTVTLNIAVPGESPGYDNQQVGLRLATADNTRVLQVQREGFTYSYLSPYSSWEDFIAEARQYWETYFDICRPDTVARVATRFINKIPIRESLFELEDYFHLYPTFPKVVNPNVTGVFMQMRQPVPQVPGAAATINFSDTVDNAGTPTACVAFLLDFDVAVEGDWNAADEAKWSILDSFRGVKNAYFEGSITDKCRSLFQ